VVGANFCLLYPLHNAYCLTYNGIVIHGKARYGGIQHLTGIVITDQFADFAAFQALGYCGATAPTQIFCSVRPVFVPCYKAFSTDSTDSTGPLENLV
jgi:hypothetical protein